MEERQYILPPHPEAVVVSDEKTSIHEAPAVAENSLSDLIRQAVGEVRNELMVELEAQTTRLQVQLQADLQKEIQGGFESNVKNQESPVGGRA